MSNMISFNIEEELKKLPTKPGVYLMHGPEDEIIYVGKAKNLKNRVRQYFQSDKQKTVTIKRMISLIRRFEYIVVDSEMEAFVLENNLIKENKPKYNTLLKDDKTYPYIKVTTNEEYPRLFITRKVKKDKAKYFGPYTTGMAVKDIIELLHKIFMIRDCNRKLPEDIGKERPCLFYDIGQCSGPCGGFVTREEYKKQVDRAAEFLSGKYDYVKNILKNRMQTASDNMEYEKAIEYRELLKNTESIFTKQKVSALDNDDRDVIGIAKEKSDAVCEVFLIRNGVMVGRENYHMAVDEEESITDILSAFLKQYYTGTPFIPSEIWTQTEPIEEELIISWLRSQKDSAVSIKTPKRGINERLVEMAVSNALNILTKDREKILREEKKTKGAVNAISNMLGIDSLSRIESYDISNISGFNSVGSMVVFVDGKPKKNDYRKFKIKSVNGPDDYASLYEVLSRRFKRAVNEENTDKEDSFNILPDLIMMDGGKGQIKMAKKALSDLNLCIPVSGMVKDDHHRTRALLYNDKELEIDTHSDEFNLITRIQDETHRFAIDYHRSLRGKEAVRSVLDDINGIGKVRRRALMMHYKDINDIKNASVEELSQIDGMDTKSAKAVSEFFHNS